MTDFVSGRGTNEPKCVSYHETLAAEIEAEWAANETKMKSSQKRRRSSSIPWQKRPLGPVQMPFNPFHIGTQKWSEYETQPEMTRIHKAVKRIETQMDSVQSAFDTLLNPNSKARRTLRRILKRLRHEIDGMVAQ